MTRHGHNIPVEKCSQVDDEQDWDDAQVDPSHQSFFINIGEVWYVRGQVNATG